MATESRTGAPTAIPEYPQTGCGKDAGGSDGRIQKDSAGSHGRSRKVTQPDDERWKQNFFDKVQQRGLDLQQTTVEAFNHVRAEEKKLHRKSPPDPLAREWFSPDKATVDTRAYVLERLLPAVVPGVEKLLMEAEKRQLLEPSGVSPKFNPVNFLGEYLMRNNPQIVSGSTGSPYSRGLRNVLDDLKSQVFNVEFNRLGQLKQEMRATRQQRTQVEGIQTQVKERRKEALALQFPEWPLDVRGRIPVALVQSALKSFLEVASHSPLQPNPVSYSRDLASDDTLEQKLNAEEFVEYVSSYIQPLGTDLFLELLHHLSQCADVFRETIRHDRWRQMFSDLFLSCDHGKVGVLDRQRVLVLLEAFYDRGGSQVAAWGFRNPRQWPMIEFREMDPSDFWVDFDEGARAAEPEGPPSVAHSMQGFEVSVPDGGELEASAAGTAHMSLEQEGPLVEQGVDSMLEQQIMGVPRAAPEIPNGSAGEAVPTVLGEVAIAVPSSEMPVRQENTNTNARKDQLSPGPALENMSAETQGTLLNALPGATETATNGLNTAPEMASSASGQRLSVVPDAPLGGAQPELISGPESSAMDRKSDADKEPASVTVTEVVPPKESSADLTGGTGASEDESTGSAPPSTVEEARGMMEDMSLEKAAQCVDGIPWSGDLLTSDLALKYGSYGDRSQDEWSVAASRFTDLRSIITDLHSWGPPRVTSAFDGSTLNLPQFVQLMETFLGEETPLPVVEELVTYLRSGYVETEEEKFQQLAKARREAFSARKKLVLEALFQKWDNEGSGVLELSELEATLTKYKEGMETDLLRIGREHLRSAHACRDAVKISSRDFQRYIESIIVELPGAEEEVFGSLVEFLTASVARTQAERMRGSARRKWLHEIQRAADSSGGSLEPVYQAVFQALYKDAESHGNNKRISASIGLLEQSPPGAARGGILLRYVACTMEDAPYVLNKVLYRDMKGVSFAAVDEGKPVHVPRVQYHGNIQFWKQDRPQEERTGSFLVLPLKDTGARIFGTLGIDTIRDPRERNIFLTHEISFYQGVSHTFSEAYHYVQTRQNILLLVSSALAWIHNRAPNIQSVTTYLMEPGTEKAPDYVLRKTMTTDNNTGLSVIHPTPLTLRRKENLFRDYLFKCADSSEVLTTDAYGERHIAVPIREPAGRAMGVIDVSTGSCRDLPAHEFQDLQKMLQMLQAACNEILAESEGETEKTFVLEAERAGEESRMGVLFHRIMLQDLRECVQKLDHQSFAELKSYKEPPTMIHSILRAVLLLFNPEWASSEEVESWSQCKLKVNTHLVKLISTFDPTARSGRVQPELVAKYIKGIPRGAVWRHGSIPAEHLYNWAFTCLSLMELTPSQMEAPEAGPSPEVEA